LEQKGGIKVGKVVQVCVEGMGEGKCTCSSTLVYFGMRQRAMANLAPQFLYVWGEHARCWVDPSAGLGGPHCWSGCCFGEDRYFLPTRSQITLLRTLQLV